MAALTMEKLVALCKGRGFVFNGSEIYGGLANTWDYGPLGSQLVNNIKAAWWKKFVTEQKQNVGMDCSILMNNAVWKASGHIGGFSDPLIDCRECKTRHRADELIENYARKKMPELKINGWSDNQLSDFIDQQKIACPRCGKSNFTPIRKFNLMFKTFLGVTEENKDAIYLRPETAQGIFVNFQNIQRTSRLKLPFGVGQIGKAFRNEITPGNFIFRVIEFEQMELEFFTKPNEDLKWFEYWKDFCKNWLTELGIKDKNLRIRNHDAEELSHYSKATSDFEFLFPFGWGELWGIADRTDFDLKCHATGSGKSMEYVDPTTNERYVPYCIEPSVGVGRLFLAFLCNAYDEEEVDGETRVVLRLHGALAPFKAAILPLQKDLSPKADEVFDLLRQEFACTYDAAGSIGKRYRRQDEIGTPFCITIDYDTLTDNTVTIRERDSMAQVRMPIGNLAGYIAEKVTF